MLKQMNGEFAVIQQFLETADSVGLAIPGDHPWFRIMPGAEPVGKTIGTNEWPKEQILELLAIAQHHEECLRVSSTLHTAL